MRSKVKEVAARSILEPTIIDVFVEGCTDVRIYNRFFAKDNAIKFKEISTVDVEVAEGGNRARLIRLAELLEREKSNLTSWKIIVDRDFDEPTPKLTNLFYTDYSCAEAYFYEEDNLCNFFNNYMSCPHDWKILEPSCSSVLLKLSKCRSLLKSHSPKIRFSNSKDQKSTTKKVLTFKDNNIKLDEEKLEKICKSKKFKASFSLSFTECRDVRMSLNGHDMMEVIAFLLKELDSKLKKDLNLENSILSTMLCCDISHNFFKKSQLYKNIFI